MKEAFQKGRFALRVLRLLLANKRAFFLLFPFISFYLHRAHFEVYFLCLFICYFSRCEVAFYT